MPLAPADKINATTLTDPTALTGLPKIHFGEVSFDPLAIGSQGNAILGIRDSGKTYAAMKLAEELMDAGIPIIAFDPIGVWRFLRVPGPDGRGYPVVVAGGAEGDLPIDAETAPALIEAAMKAGVSLVIDLFDINLSKADWRRIVEASLRTLLHKNQAYGLRHVFLEEAAEFCPQRPGIEVAKVYAEVEKLARMGGNCRLGYTLINQRSEEVAKAVLELCDNLFLFRQKGRNSLNALSKWLDMGNVGTGKHIISTLSTLPTGECWAWPQGSDLPIRVHVPAKHSLHPDRRVMRGAEGAPVVAPKVDVGTFVAAMNKLLAKPARPAAPMVGKDALIAEFERGHAVGLAKGDASGFVRGLNEAHHLIFKAIEAAGGPLDLTVRAELGHQPGEAGAAVLRRVEEHTYGVTPSDTSAPAAAAAIRANRPAPAPPPTGVSAATKKIIAFYEAVAPRAIPFLVAAKQAGVGMKSSQFRNYEPELVASGRVEAVGDRYRALVTAGSPNDYLDQVAAQLSPSHLKIFRFIQNAGRPVSKDEIIEAAEISPTSSTTTAAISLLIHEAGVVEVAGAGLWQMAEAYR